MSPRGVHGRSGPPPDPNALRREHDKNAWVTLPASREGEEPAWPLSKPTQFERRLWTELWTMPQAVVWEEQRQFQEVALYVRTYAKASRPKASASIATAVLRMADSLGLTIPGMHRNRWKLGTPQTVAKPAKRAGRQSSKERLKVLQGGGG